MALKIIPVILTYALSVVSCETGVVSFVNEKKGMLHASMKLVNIGEKKFMLDSITAPKPRYIQLYTDSSGKTDLTFVNTYDNSIYFYEYATTNFIKKITYGKKGSKTVAGFTT